MLGSSSGVGSVRWDLVGLLSSMCPTGRSDRNAGRTKSFSPHCVDHELPTHEAKQSQRQGKLEA